MRPLIVAFAVFALAAAGLAYVAYRAIDAALKAVS